MATKKGSETTMDDTKKSDDAGVTPGDWAAQAEQEFQKEGAKRVNPDVFFHKFEVGGKPNPICGVVLARRQRKQEIDQKTGKVKDPQFYYILGLTKPTVLFNGDGDVIEGKPGMFAWVDERWCISSLQSFLPRQERMDNGVMRTVEVQEVLVKPTSKKQLKGGQSVWQAEVYSKGHGGEALSRLPLIAPQANQPPPPQIREKHDDEDIPF
jgi:hypothetical protein